MKRKLLTLLTTVLFLAPIAALAQDYVFVNTDAPGVHKEYDSKRGCYVWKNGMGSYICKDSEMKSMWEMDRYVYFNGVNNDPDNPKTGSSDVRKVWDKNRGCYVWKNIYTGDFLGTDKKSVQQEDKKKAKEAAKQQKKEQQQANKQHQQKSDKHQQKTEKKQQQKNEKKQQQKHDSNADTHNTQQMLITNDQQMREAEAALKEAKAEVAAAKAQGIDLSEYHVDEYIRQAEAAIEEYKRTRNKMK